MVYIAALVKYDPCSTYARLGTPCLFKKAKKICPLFYNGCGDTKYDLWLKEVKEGKLNSFFPKHIRLLDIPGTVLLIFDCRKRAIIGEATINKVTSKKDFYDYHFEKFVTYPSIVSLSDGHHHRQFERIPVAGRWWLTYIEQNTLKDIRSLSGLEKATIDDLNRTIDKTFEKPSLLDVLVKKSNLSRQIVVISKENLPLINEANKLLSGTSPPNGNFKGRSRKNLFFACLFIIRRRACDTITYKEFCDKENIKMSDLISSVNFLTKRLNVVLPKVSIETYINKYAASLGIPENTRVLANEIASTFHNNKSLKNRNTHLLGGLALYLACIKTEIPVSQKTITEIAHMSTVSLRILYKAFSLKESDVN
jgi:hypothetical protein